MRILSSYDAGETVSFDVMRQRRRTTVSGRIPEDRRGEWRVTPNNFDHDRLMPMLERSFERMPSVEGMMERMPLMERMPEFERLPMHEQPLRRKTILMHEGKV